MTEYTEADILYGHIDYARQGVPVLDATLKEGAAEVGPDDTITLNGKYTTEHSELYPGTFTFKDEKVGTSGTAIEFIDSQGSDDSTYSATIVASQNGHRKVLKTVAAGDNGKYAAWRHNFSSAQTGGTIEFHHEYTDKGQGIHEFLVYNESNGIIIRCRFNSADNKFYVFHAATNTSVAAAAATMHHIRVIWDCATDHQWVWLNGVSVVADVAFYESRVATTANYLWLYLALGGGVNSLECYWDAFGESWDENYTVGDNIYWQQYIDKPLTWRGLSKTSTSQFELEATGISGTNIAFVDAQEGDDTTFSATIVPEFGPHKKVMQMLCAGANLKYAQWKNDFANQTDGTIELWVKYVYKGMGEQIINIYDNNNTIAIRILISSSDTHMYIYYGATSVNFSCTSNVWYHIKIQFDCGTDRQWVWVDGVLRVDNQPFYNSVTPTTLNYVYFRMDSFAGLNSGEWYIDAVGYSWTANYTVGDNLITYTEEPSFNTVLFEGYIEDVDMAVTQGITALSKSQEILQVRPNFYHQGYADIMIRKLLHEWCNVINKPSFTEVGTLSAIRPISDEIVDTVWTDAIEGNNNNILYDDIDEESPDGDRIGCVNANSSFSCNLGDYTLPSDKHYEIYKAKIYARGACAVSKNFYENLSDEYKWFGETYVTFSSSWQTLNVDNENISLSVDTPTLTFKGTYKWTQPLDNTLSIELLYVILYYGYYSDDGRIEQGTTKQILESQGEQTLKDLFHTIALQELKTWYLDVANNFHFNSGDKFSQTLFDTTSKLKFILGTRKIKSYDKVVVNGGYSGGIRITATAGTGNKIALETYNSIIDQTVLNNLAAKLLEEKGANTYDISLDWYDPTLGVPQVGETIYINSGIRFDNSNKTIPAGYYIIDEVYYYMGEGGAYNYVELRLIDILIFSLQEEDAEKRLDKNIKETATLVTQK